MANEMRNLMFASSGGGGGGGVGSLTPAYPFSYEPAYGGKPQVPNPGSSAASAIAANSGNLSALYSLLGGLNTFQAGQAANQLRLNMPNYDALIGQRSNVIGDQLQGRLAQDVVNQIIRGAAERGITTGTAYSPNSNAAYLRALGLTSRDEQALGMKNLSGAIADTPKAPLVNPESMLITPDAIQQAQMMANLYASAPDPGAAARAAIAAGSLGNKNYGGGGGISGARSVYLGGGGSKNPYQYAEPGTGAVYGSLGPYDEPKVTDYQGWQNWYNSLPGQADMNISWQGPSLPFGFEGPSSYGAPFGTVGSNSYGGFSGSSNTYYNTGMQDDFFSGWDDEFSFPVDEPSSYWNPVVDVSAGAGGGGGYDWSGSDTWAGGGY